MDTKKIDQLISDTEKRLKKLDNARAKVLTELEELNRIKKARFQIRESAPLFLYAGITKESPADEKISLFRSLFRGREDIYAIRWESVRSGRAGYQPACRNEWVHGVCQKPVIKCRECAARDFLPLTSLL